MRDSDRPSRDLSTRTAGGSGGRTYERSSTDGTPGTMKAPTSAPLILVVDDMRLYRNIATDQLNRDGFRVAGVTSGEEALAFIAVARPDLVLLDMSMRGIDGVETCKRMKANAATRDIPIIFFSALDDVNQVIAGLEAGASDYVTKPFRPAELLARVRAHVRLKLLQDERTRLYRFATALQGAGSMDDALEIIRGEMSGLLPGVSGAAYLLRDAGDLLEIKTIWGGVSPEIAQSISAHECLALQRGEPYPALHAEASHCRHVSVADMTRSLCIPLRMHGESLGLLCLTRTHSDPSPSQDSNDDLERQRAEEVALHVALNLGNLRLRETLRRQSIRDSLTGLFNRRYLEESIVRELSRAGREGLPVGVIMLDIDHFKRFNDTWGHDAGDAVLRDVAAALRNGIRTGDIACRFGGEELLAILPGANRDVTCRRAEQLLNRICGLRLEHRDASLGTITASMGVAVYPEHGEDSESLLRAADAALYESKQAGRNRISVARAAWRGGAGSRPPA